MKDELKLWQKFATRRFVEVNNIDFAQFNKSVERWTALCMLHDIQPRFVVFHYPENTSQEILERLDALIAEGAPQASIIRHKAAKTDEQPKTITLGAYLNAFELYFGEEVSHVGEAKV